jgi:hypothetical protein
MAGAKTDALNLVLVDASGLTLASAGRSGSRASGPDPSASVGRIVSLPEGFHTAKASGVSEGVALTSRRYAGGSMLGLGRMRHTEGGDTVPP